MPFYSFTICGNISNILSIEQPSNLFGIVLSPVPNELDHCALMNDEASKDHLKKNGFKLGQDYKFYTLIRK